MSSVSLCREPIDLRALENAVQAAPDGALVSFVGVVRNEAHGRAVLRLEYHAFEPMALKQLQQIAEEAEERWPVRAVVVHRLGTLEVGEASVAIVVASPHRGDGFAACRHIIEEIKARVPIWKREHYGDGAVWIEESPDRGPAASGRG